jgi:hypothetical protein
MIALIFETLSYFSNTSISEEEYWQIYECLTKNKPFCMIMCWSIFGCGNNIKKDLELHKKTPAYTLPTLPNTKAFKWLSIKSRVKGFLRVSIDVILDWFF